MARVFDGIFFDLLNVILASALPMCGNPKLSPQDLNRLPHLTLQRLVGFVDFRAKTTRSHVALRERNSGAESGRELFKPSKDTASLLDCTRKKLFWFGVRIFCE